jgi:hypothetical protein
MRSNLLNYRKNKRSQQEDDCIIIFDYRRSTSPYSSILLSTPPY